MSNVKVNSSCDFNLAFDLSAVFRPSLALLVISHSSHQRQIQEISAPAHTWGQQPVGSYWENKQGQRADCPKYFLQGACILHMWLYT